VARHLHRAAERHDTCGTWILVGRADWAVLPGTLWLCLVLFGWLSGVMASSFLALWCVVLAALPIVQVCLWVWWLWRCAAQATMCAILEHQTGGYRSRAFVLRDGGGRTEVELVSVDPRGREVRFRRVGGLESASRSEKEEEWCFADNDSVLPVVHVAPPSGVSGEAGGKQRFTGLRSRRLGRRRRKE
jgi:hypothetical protein